MISTIVKAPFLALLLMFVAAANAGAQLITSFGNSVTDSGSGWTYTGATSTLSGSELAGASLTDVSAPLNLNLTGATGLSLTAKVTTDPLSNFTITLEDNSGTNKTAIATFDWTSFVGVASSYTVQAAFGSVSPGFDYAHVAYWTIDSGSSNASINAMFTSLAAIPEPTSMFLLCVGGIVLAGFRRFTQRG